MITFGLTGGIACGKSTATKTFRDNKIPIVDADVIAREVVMPGTYGHAVILKTFGIEYLLPDGSLDRVKFGNYVFSDKDALRQLDMIMRPLIREEADLQLIQKHSAGYPIVGYDAALICETGHADDFRPLIVVACPQVTQIERLMTRNALTREQAMARISAQMPLENKIKMADFVIDTSGAIEDSIKQTQDIIQKLRAMQ